MEGRKSAWSWARVLLFLSVGVVSTAHAQTTDEPHGGGAVSARALALAANNPTAPVNIVQLRNVMAPVVPGTTGVANVLQLEPVISILPSDVLPFAQLIKLTVPMPSLPSPDNVTGLGDIDIFDMVTIKESWGRWGIGVTFVFPTATATALGQGKWQVGPAAGLIFTGVPNLVLGAILQNPISFAGDSSRPSVNALIITPSITYNLAGGWFGGMSDFNMVFNWMNGGTATIPVGVQFGKVFTIGKQPFSLSLEGAYNVAVPSGAIPAWLIGIELSAIFAAG